MKIVEVSKGVCLTSIWLLCHALDASAESIAFEYRCYRLSTNEIAQLTNQLAPLQRKRDQIFHTATTNGQGMSKEARSEASRLSSAINSNKLQFIRTLSPIVTNRLAVRPGARFDHAMTVEGKPLRFGGITGWPRDNTGQSVHTSPYPGDDSLWSPGNWWLYYDNSQRDAMTGAAFGDKDQLLFDIGADGRLFLVVEPRMSK